MTEMGQLRQNMAQQVQDIRDKMEAEVARLRGQLADQASLLPILSLVPSVKMR